MLLKLLIYLKGNLNHIRIIEELFSLNRSVVNFNKSLKIINKILRLNQVQ